MANDDGSDQSFFQRVPARLLTVIAIERARSAANLTLEEQRRRDGGMRLQRPPRARIAPTTKRR